MSGSVLLTVDGCTAATQRGAGQRPVPAQLHQGQV